jgi:atrazine chlorohydrolase/5-methylthioadenosine/S-adenosylhomocysteine deaminase
VIDDEVVAAEGGRIAAVGPTADVAAGRDTDRVIDVEAGAVIPGLINPHTHVSDVLLRGSFAEDRGLLDWLSNVKRPATLSRAPEEHATAARLYCVEAIRSGVTTFIENDIEVVWDDWSTISLA